MENVSNKFNNASRWSILAEVVSKLTPPITNMVLARLLTPNAFGMVATVTMITSFAEIFADAGFQKYLVQHEFYDSKDLDRDTSVAFWTNISISILLWCIIYVLRNSIAQTVGNPGLGNAISVAALAMPLVSLSSIQMARFRRDFDFKTLFFVKLVATLIPVVVTIPVAFITRSYWALIIGTLAVHVSNVVLTTIKSVWRPTLFFELSRLKKMFAFSMWTLLEQLLGWANLNVGIFLVGKYLSEYYLGIYKTSMAYVNQIMGIIITALSPVLLSALSRLKENDDEYKDFFYDFEKKVSMIILPLGIGIYVFRELFTNILLGSQWSEAIGFIGLWALMRSLQTVFGIFSMEVFISYGKPQLSVLEQCLVLIVLLPILITTARIDYNMLYHARAFVVLWAIFVEMLLLKLGVNISPSIIIKNALPYMLCSIMMGIVGNICLTVSRGIIWQVLSALICVIFYFGIVYVVPHTRQDLRQLVNDLGGISIRK